MADFYTIGHSNRAIGAFLSLLTHEGVALLIDVRTLPRSRLNPQFNNGPLAQSLHGAAIGYRHLPALGGLRHAREDGHPSPNTYWENSHFRNFADYTATAGFQQGFDELLELGSDLRNHVRGGRLAALHRQIIADYLLAAGERVIHIVREDRLEEGLSNRAAVFGADGIITYPAAQARLL